MSSAIFFRLHHGKQSEQINFEGSGLRLIELKKAIVEKKAMTGSLDFDLKVTDENDSERVFAEDDEVVPKNSSVVVRRVPAKSTATSLISRINNLSGGNSRHHHNMPHASDANRTNDIVINVKADDPYSPMKPAMPQPVLGRQPSELATSAVLADEEAEALKAISAADKVDGRAGDGMGRGNMIRRPAYTPQPQPAAGSLRVPQGYSCHRCGQTGHYIKFCPTNGDPTFDPVNRLLNVPMASRKKFNNLEGVDTANKTVVQNTDGSYEVFEPSRAGREKIARESESVAIANLELAEANAPENLKCPLSRTLLREAVVLPCCKQCVNDTAIRQELLNNGLRCPLCDTDNVSPDSREVRNMVEEFIASVVRRTAENESNQIEVEREQLSVAEANIRSQFEDFKKPTSSSMHSAQPKPPLPVSSNIIHTYGDPAAMQPGMPGQPPYPMGNSNQQQPLPGMYQHHNPPPPASSMNMGMGNYPPAYPNNPNMPRDMNMPNMPPMGMNMNMNMPPPMNMGAGGPMQGGPMMGMGMNMPPMGLAMHGGPPMPVAPYGGWRSAAEVPRDMLFPPLNQEEFLRERQFQINEARHFEERRKEFAIENAMRREREREQRISERRDNRSGSRDKKAHDTVAASSSRHHNSDRRSRSSDRRDRDHNRSSGRERDRSTDRVDRDRPRSDKDVAIDDKAKKDKSRDDHRDSKGKDKDIVDRDSHKVKEREKERMDSRDRKDRDRKSDANSRSSEKESSSSSTRKEVSRREGRSRSANREKSNKESDTKARDNVKVRSHEKDREKEKDREREKEKERQREKDRERDRDRNREKDREKAGRDSDKVDSRSSKRSRDDDRVDRDTDRNHDKDKDHRRVGKPSEHSSGRTRDADDVNPSKRQKANNTTNNVVGLSGNAGGKSYDANTRGRDDRWQGGGGGGRADDKAGNASAMSGSGTPSNNNKSGRTVVEVEVSSGDKKRRR